MINSSHCWAEWFLVKPVPATSETHGGMIYSELWLQRHPAPGLVFGLDVKGMMPWIIAGPTNVKPWREWR
jgi:hypothetical protein